MASIFYFWRVASDPTWAAKVVLADLVAGLVSAAIPGTGVTKDGEELLFVEAARFGTEVQFAPTAEQRANHLRFAHEHMTKIGILLSKAPGRAGVDAVRAAVLRKMEIS